MKTFGPNDLIYGITRYFFWLWGTIKKITATPGIREPRDWDHLDPV